jgi:hypothetical protein
MGAPGVEFVNDGIEPGLLAADCSRDRGGSPSDGASSAAAWPRIDWKDRKILAFSNKNTGFPPFSLDPIA